MANRTTRKEIRFTPEEAADREVLGEMFSISEQEMRYITDSGPGRGLLKVGTKLIPFVLELPPDTELYKLMTTKLAEVDRG